MLMGGRRVAIRLRYRRAEGSLLEAEKWLTMCGRSWPLALSDA